MRFLHAEVALLVVCAAGMGCSSPQVEDAEKERSAPDDVPRPEGWTPIQMGLVRNAQLFPAMYDVHGVRTNLLYCWSWVVNGLDLGALVNFSYAAHGLQVSGFGNSVGAEGWGLQVAGHSNTVGRREVPDGYSGLQLAGWFNAGSSDGIQLAGVSNGVFWRREGRADHSHWNHGFNIPGHIRGLQVAGITNVARHVAGAQVSSVVNVSLDGFHGLQVGAINVAESKADSGDRGRVLCSGVQLGVFNAAGIFSPSVQAAGSCVQVGVINVVDGGAGIQFGLWNSNPDGFLPHFPILNFSF